MKHQLQTIRAFIDAAYTTGWPRLEDEKAAREALSEIERMAGEQEPVQLDHIACIDDGELRYMTGRKAPAYDCELYAMPDGKRAPKLYDAPPAQQPQHDHVAVTWDAARTRILAVTLQDAEGRVLCVIDEAPAQQPQYEAGDMASAAAQGFRDGVASVVQQPQARPDFADEWTGYLKDGETPFERFLRERKDLNALTKLYQRALEENERLKDQQPQAEADMRRVCEALGFDPTNHHNAAKCPYCRGQQPQAECTRSHPHENMDGYCVLRTEIARLTNENARLQAQQPPEIEVQCPVCNHKFYEWPGEHKVQQPQAEAAPEMHDALCPALTGGDCTCTPPAIIDKVWAQFCGGIGRGPDAPYPGMIEAFESHYGQTFTDKDWREETGVWAAAWKAAKAHGEAAPQQAEAVPPGYVLVPKRMTKAMEYVTEQEDWTWGDLLAAAEAITEAEYSEMAQAEAVPSDVTRDAARYLWLRSKVGVSPEHERAYIWLPCGNSKINPAETDAAIDAAMAQGEKP